MAISIKAGAKGHACRPSRLVTEGHIATLTVEDSYEIQWGLRCVREERGEKVIGYKIGCTSSRIRQQLGAPIGT